MYIVTIRYASLHLTSFQKLKQGILVETNRPLK